jgi:hypothetical protein
VELTLIAQATVDIRDFEDFTAEPGKIIFAITCNKIIPFRAVIRSISEAFVYRLVSVDVFECGIYYVLCTVHARRFKAKTMMFTKILCNSIFAVSTMTDNQ